MGIQPVSAVGREDQDQTEGRYNDLLAQSLRKQEESRTTLTEMIREAKEKADAQREKFKLAKAAPRYGDAPLEAYARLARARSRMEVNAASGYARRRLAQFKTALRTDSDNAAKIKAAINQLQKAVNRGERKKRELDREHLTEVRRKRAAKEDLKEKERRLKGSPRQDHANPYPNRRPGVSL